MTADPKQEAIKNAHRAAREESYVGWFFLGFLVPFVAVLLAFASKPIMPGRVMASHDDESTRRIFETSYLHRVNEERVGTAWGGTAVAIAISLFIGLPLIISSLSAY